MTPESRAKWNLMPTVAQDRIIARAVDLARQTGVTFDEAQESIVARTIVHSAKATHGTGH